MPILANRAMVSCTRRVPLTMVRDAHFPVIMGILLIPETSVVMQMVYGSQATLRVKVKYFIFVVVRHRCQKCCFILRLDFHFQIPYFSYNNIHKNITRL